MMNQTKPPFLEKHPLLMPLIKISSLHYEYGKKHSDILKSWKGILFLSFDFSILLSLHVYWVQKRERMRRRRRRKMRKKEKKREKMNKKKKKNKKNKNLKKNKK